MSSSFLDILEKQSSQGITRHPLCASDRSVYAKDPAWRKGRFWQNRAAEGSAIDAGPLAAHTNLSRTTGTFGSATQVFWQRAMGDLWQRSFEYMVQHVIFNIMHSKKLSIYMRAYVLYGAVFLLQLET